MSSAVPTRVVHHANTSKTGRAMHAKHRALARMADKNAPVHDKESILKWLT